MSLGVLLGESSNRAWALLSVSTTSATRPTKGRTVSASIDPLEDYFANPPVVDTVQDHPAAWDWRIIVVFIVAAATVLYLL